MFDYNAATKSSSLRLNTKSQKTFVSNTEPCDSTQLTMNWLARCNLEWLSIRTRLPQKSLNYGRGSKGTETRGKKCKWVKCFQMVAFEMLNMSMWGFFACQSLRNLTSSSRGWWETHTDGWPALIHQHLPPPSPRLTPPLLPDITHSTENTTPDPHRSECRVKR